jgi:hypothetical protein
MRTAMNIKKFDLDVNLISGSTVIQNNFCNTSHIHTNTRRQILLINPPKKQLHQ